MYMYWWRHQADNEIEKLTGLDALTELQRLHVRGNKISSLKGIENALSITYLNLRWVTIYNEICDAIFRSDDETETTKSRIWMR